MYPVAACRGRAARPPSNDPPPMERKAEAPPSTPTTEGTPMREPMIDAAQPAELPESTMVKVDAYRAPGWGSGRRAGSDLSMGPPSTYSWRFEAAGVLPANVMQVFDCGPVDPAQEEIVESFGERHDPGEPPIVLLPPSPGTVGKDGD